MLTLPIKKKWFDMILSGEKKEEYREIKPYYEKRFSNYFMGENKLLVGAKREVLTNGCLPGLIFKSPSRSETDILQNPRLL